MQLSTPIHLGGAPPTNFEKQTVSVTVRTCINISTYYNNDIMNVDKQFIVTVSSDKPAVFVNPDMATASVTIQNSKFYLKLNLYYS